MKRTCSLFSVLIMALLFLSLPPGFCAPAESGTYMKEVTVKQGDSLSHICKKYYGVYSRELKERIRRYNPSIPPSGAIRTGETLKLPFEKTDSVQSALKTAPKTVPKTVPKGAHMMPPEPGPEPERSLSPKKYDMYPALMNAEISKLEWIKDNVAVVSGKIMAPQGSGVSIKLFVSVPGDLDYEQRLVIEGDGSFVANVCIGRPNQDYGRKFILKLVQSEGGRGVSGSQSGSGERGRFPGGSSFREEKPQEVLDRQRRPRQVDRNTDCQGREAR
jgi:hypothetical protein